MRKSYEGKVKTFGLAGRNRAVKQEDDKPGSLLSLVRWPDEEWQNQKVAGKDIRLGLPGVTLTKLEAAMKMEPGAVPENAEWEYSLGVEKPKPLSPVAEHSKKVLQQNAKVNGKLAAVATSSANDAIRPKRTGRKRRYDEHSFEGYGEGYVDDDGDVTGGGGYSSGDASRRSSTSKKKRKKVDHSLLFNVSLNANQYPGLRSNQPTYRQRTYWQLRRWYDRCLWTMIRE